MLAIFFTIAFLALLDSSFALGGLKSVRPPSAHVRRSGVESIEAGVVHWGYETTPLNSAIIPVSLSSDGQYVVWFVLRFGGLIILSIGHTFP